MQNWLVEFRGLFVDDMWKSWIIAITMSKNLQDLPISHSKQLFIKDLSQ